MRKIKFRFWDIRAKAWAGFHVIEPIMICDRDIYPWTWKFPTEDFIPVEFTGLKDKNGKDIYEGDILGPLLSGVVQWDNIRGKYVVQLTPEGWHDLASLVEMKEVVGNIYETPSMLDTTQEVK